MFLSLKFLRYGKPLAAAAPIMLALSGLPSPAHACTGDAATDPNLCINDGRTVDGFGEFYNSDLTGIPGTVSVPGSTDPGSTDPGSTDDGNDSTPGLQFGGFGRFGLYYDEPSGGRVGYAGPTDNGLEFTGRLRN